VKTNYLFYFTAFFLIQFNSTLSALATEVELIQDKDFKKGGISTVSPIMSYIFRTYTAKDEALNSSHKEGSYKSYTLNGSTCLEYGVDKNSLKRYLLKYPRTATTSMPIWSLGQWDSKGAIGLNSADKVVSGYLTADGRAVEFRDGDSTSAYKKLKIGQLGSGYRYLHMRLNGYEEYNGVLGPPMTSTISGNTLTFPTGTSTQKIYDRVADKYYTVSASCFERPHPQLLIGATIPPQQSIGQMNSLNLKMQMKVLDNYLKGSLVSGFNAMKAQMTAHFKIHVQIQNMKTNSDGTKPAGYGQGINLSINAFDVRFPDPSSAISGNPEGAWLHRPTLSLMRMIPASDFGANFLQNLYNNGNYKKWATLNIDLLKYLKGNCPTPQAIAPAGCLKSFFQMAQEYCTSAQWSSGTCPITPRVSENLSDYYVTNLNFGWEVSSPHNVEMQISDMGLTYTPSSP